MEKIDFKKQNIPFTQVANGVLYDKGLSLGSKAVYAFMYSKPDGWQFSAQRMAQELGVSRPTVLKHLEELKTLGYLISQRQSNGRMLYKVLFPPVEPQSKNLTMEPQSKKATVKKSHSKESLPISNTLEYKVIRNTNFATKSPRGSFKGIEDFLTSKQKHIQIIGRYFHIKGIVYDSPQEWTTAAKRWMRTATALSKFADDKVERAFEKAKEWPEWTLETIFKKLTS